MERPDDEEVFRRLEQLANNHLQLLNPAVQSALLRYLINISIQNYNKGEKEYLSHQFNLYRLGLERELFFDEGRLPDATFLNIIVTATVLGEQDWVESFIAQYAPLLPTGQQMDAVSLGTAYWYFSKERFMAAIDLLRQVQDTRLAYQLRVKSLSLRSYFELFLKDDSYYELLLHDAEAFEKSLRRHAKMTERRVLSYLNMISFIRKFAKLKRSGRQTPERVAGLRAKIKEERLVIARPWLLDKMQ